MNVRKYCSTEKTREWNREETPTDMRWTEIFKQFEQDHIPYKHFAPLVHFVLCLPGSTAYVERMVSSVNAFWVAEESHSRACDVKTMLLVRLNLDYSCADFYDFIKSRDDILKQFVRRTRWNEEEDEVEEEVEEKFKVEEQDIEVDGSE